MELVEKDIVEKSVRTALVRASAELIAKREVSTMEGSDVSPSAALIAASTSITANAMPNPAANVDNPFFVFANTDAPLEYPVVLPQIVAPCIFSPAGKFPKLVVGSFFVRFCIT